MPGGRVVQKQGEGPIRLGRTSFAARHVVKEYYGLDGALLKRTIDVFREGQPDGKADIAEFYSDGRLVVQEVFSPGGGTSHPSFERYVYSGGELVYSEGKTAADGDLADLGEEMSMVHFLGGPDGLHETVGFGGKHGVPGHALGYRWQQPNEIPLYAEYDRNKDGRVDEISVWENGLFTTTTIYLDEDFDGQADKRTVKYYEDEKNKMTVTRVETASLQEDETPSLELPVGAEAAKELLRKSVLEPEPSGTEAKEPRQAIAEERRPTRSTWLLFVVGLFSGIVLGGIGVWFVKRRMAS